MTSAAIYARVSSARQKEQETIVSHLERAAAELEEASLAWGVWADGVRTLAERRLGVSAAGGFAVLDDPGYARALRMGAWFDQAAAAAGTALEAAGGACPGPG